MKLVKVLISLNFIEAPVSGPTTSCHLLCLIHNTYKHYLPQDNKQTKESWEVPYPINVLFFIATFFLCVFPGFRESKFSCAWMCFMFSIQLSIRSAGRQKTSNIYNYIHNQKCFIKNQSIFLAIIFLLSDDNKMIILLPIIFLLSRSKWFLRWSASSWMLSRSKNIFEFSCNKVPLEEWPKEGLVRLRGEDDLGGEDNNS